MGSLPQHHNYFQSWFELIHDGLSSYRLYAGLYRLVCSNGFFAGEEYEDVKVRHSGDVVGNVIEGTYSIIDTAKQLINVADKMSSTLAPLHGL